MAQIQMVEEREREKNPFIVIDRVHTYVNCSQALHMYTWRVSTNPVFAPPTLVYNDNNTTKV